MGMEEIPYSSVRLRLFVRVKEKLTVNEKTRCWEWLTGKPVLRVRGKKEPAARVMYSIVHGWTPARKEVLKHCENKLCCNPSHLYVK